MILQISAFEVSNDFGPILMPTCLHVSLQSFKMFLNVHLWSHRSFIIFGFVLASNLGPSWEPRRLTQNPTRTILKSSRGKPKSGSEYDFAFEHRLRASLYDFFGGLCSIFDDFWVNCRVFWLTLSVFSAALDGGAGLVFVVLG